MASLKMNKKTGYGSEKDATKHMVDTPEKKKEYYEKKEEKKAKETVEQPKLTKKETDIKMLQSDLEINEKLEYADIFHADLFRVVKITRIDAFSVRVKVKTLRDEHYLNLVFTTEGNEGDFEKIGNIIDRLKPNSLVPLILKGVCIQDSVSVYIERE